VSVVGLGSWQLGGDWGQVSDADAMSVLHAALDAGVTFLDTADVYGDGRSEVLIGRLLAERPDVAVTVATKMGRRANPHIPQAFTVQAFRNWTDRSRANLGVEVLDLVQLHCPPTSVFSDDRVFDALETLVAEQRIAAYGVSVETCHEALAAIARPNVATVQIILNVFRRKPLERVLPAAVEAGVGIIARVPLASGLLSGKYDESTTFAPGDHRTYNRQGQAFDVGETFSGVPFEVGVRAARSVAGYAKETTTAQLALRWILDQPGVSTVIPGARNASQVRGNAAAGDLEPLSADVLEALRDIYNGQIRQHVHDRW
jgi:aryl-alcohol dehydrogenase-like predicted oxidoreductase